MCSRESIDAITHVDELKVTVSESVPSKRRYFGLSLFYYVSAIVVLIVMLWYFFTTEVRLEIASATDMGTYCTPLKHALTQEGSSYSFDSSKASTDDQDSWPDSMTLDLTFPSEEAIEAVYAGESAATLAEFWAGESITQCDSSMNMISSTNMEFMEATDELMTLCSDSSNDAADILKVAFGYESVYNTVYTVARSENGPYMCVQYYEREKFSSLVLAISFTTTVLGYLAMVLVIWNYYGKPTSGSDVEQGKTAQ